MPNSEPVPSAIAALTEKELEILRLLTAGHTVKSIAARLDRSETSIHERLRDARRKTGVGSSRELARLVDSQKFWDKNIDLSKHGSPDDVSPQPQSRGRETSKGTLVMLIALPVAAAGLLALAAQTAQPAGSAASPEVAAAQQLPLEGTWALDVGRIPDDDRPQRVTIAFHVSPDRKWTTQVDIVAADGAQIHAASTAALDGVAVPVTGNMPAIDSVSLRQPAANTLVMTLGKDGVPVSTRVYTVSRDRKTMTETIVWAGQTIPKLETTYFSRIG